MNKLAALRKSKLVIGGVVACLVPLAAILIATATRTSGGNDGDDGRGAHGSDDLRQASVAVAAPGDVAVAAAGAELAESNASPALAGPLASSAARVGKEEDEAAGVPAAPPDAAARVSAPSTRPSVAAVRTRPPAPPRPTDPAPAAVAAQPAAARPDAAAAVAAAPGSESTPATQDPFPDREEGIYLIREDRGREPLLPTIVSRIGEEGGGLFSRPQLFAIVNGAKSPVRTKSHYQAFEFVFPEGGTAITGQVTSPSQYVLVQMYEEGDYDERTLDIVSGALDPEVIVPFTIERIDSRTYRVTPAEPLGLGEFCFFVLEGGSDLHPGLTIFDFGVDP